MFPTLPILFHPITIPTHRSAPHNLTCKARLVIVAGPALQPTPPFHFHPLLILDPSHPHCYDPACHCGRSRLPSSPSSPLLLPTPMARLVIVAGPAMFPTLPILSHPIFIPSHRSTPHTTSHVRPGLSLWLVPPYNQHPLFTSIPSLYPTPVTSTVKARLVIVAGPAFRPFRHLPPFCSPQWPGLSLWQVPPCSQHAQSSSIPSLYPIIG